MPRKAKPATSPIPLTHPAARIQLRGRLARWFETHGRDLPWRRSPDPYAVLVSEFMLQQTQVATVRPYFARWIERFPTFRALAAAPESDVLHAWQGLGYYARARNLHAAARQVVDLHDGALPDDDDAIAALPGVGRYTRGAIASFAFDRPVPAVDANIARVLARLFAIGEPIDTTAGSARVWEAAELLLPATGGRLHNSALMELGALVCLPRQPQCLVCPARAFCAGTGAAELFPIKKPRRTTVALNELCGWSVQRDRVLLEQQTGSRWVGLWKIPPLTGAVPVTPPLWEATYPFTHHRITLRVYPQQAPSSLRPTQRWFTRSQLESAALPSPHRRALDVLLASEKH